MVENEVVLTREGLDKLKLELEDLKSNKRKEIASRIKTAIGYGDLSENSEYESAKNDQAFLEGRILTLSRLLNKARVADLENIDTSSVRVGSFVSLNDLEFAEKIKYQVVGPAESNLSDNKISYESPLGKALMGKAVGDIIIVAAPMGSVQYELLEIRATI